MVIWKRTLTKRLLNTIHGEWGKEYFPCFCSYQTSIFGSSLNLLLVDGIPRQVGCAGLTFF